ncbi:hypothetical protein [Argonema galeatum]|uniref:hypothetical protein n=1 Tax=Argonema galeatum TaxID=2942762 RepID=UPI0023E0150C|nr:hypothetical protein [Argonema galeatum]MCL1468830.1 hypothetical protein [Argonema galeatum A003/A1]
MVGTIREIRSALVGMIYGEATLRKNLGGAVVLKIIHSERQKEYLEYKSQIIQSMFGYELKVRSFDNNGYPGVELVTRNHARLRSLYPVIYKNGKKQFTQKGLKILTPLGIALWYLDDGSLSYKRREGKIHGRELTLNTYCSEAEAQLVKIYFEEQWDIHWTVVPNKSWWRLRMGAKEGRKLISLIDPFVTDCMRYKIDLKLKDTASATAPDIPCG